MENEITSNELLVECIMEAYTTGLNGSSTYPVELNSVLMECALLPGVRESVCDTLTRIWKAGCAGGGNGVVINAHNDILQIKRA